MARRTRTRADLLAEINELKDENESLTDRLDTIIGVAEGEDDEEEEDEDEENSA